MPILNASPAFWRKRSNKVKESPRLAGAISQLILVVVILFAKLRDIVLKFFGVVMRDDFALL